MDIDTLRKSLLENSDPDGPCIEDDRMQDAATALSTLQAENEKLRAELENYRKGHREEAISALSSPNEWVNRVRELDELYTKLQIITGFTVEQLLEMFAAGYTLEKPDYSKSFEEMASLAETTPPNEPLTLEELREMDGEPVYMTFPSDTGNQCGHWALVGTQRWGAVSLIYGCGWSSYESAVETLGAKFYRRPPEGEEHCYG